MKLIIHTKYGKFEGKYQSFDQKKYDEIGEFLMHIHKLETACFETADGEIYFTKEMLNDCLIQLLK